MRCHPLWSVVGLLLLSAAFSLGGMPASVFSQDSDRRSTQGDPKMTMPEKVRVATFNVSLYGKTAGEIRNRLSGSDDLQAKRLAAIVQRVRPDILLVNELDYEEGGEPATGLADNYFAVPQKDPATGEMMAGLQYPYRYSAPANTGIDSSLDLNRDGKLGTGNDAWGYGVYPGQYAMTVFSRFPIQTEEIRTFQRFKWKDLPDALRPIQPGSNEPYYDDVTWGQLRLSSKNHIDVPVLVGDQSVHVLASHPTPPVFDGPEDRNGARNHDEIDFWVRYLDNDPSSREWMKDDRGQAGGLEADSQFFVMGDLNADPADGNGRRAAIKALLSHPRASDPQPSAPAEGVRDRQSRHQGKGDLQHKTADFGRNGYMRVDYVIPSSELEVSASGVFWPARSHPHADWLKASDHRLVWVDIRF